MRIITDSKWAAYENDMLRTWTIRLYSIRESTKQYVSNINTIRKACSDICASKLYSYIYNQISCGSGKLRTMSGWEYVPNGWPTSASWSGSIYVPTGWPTRLQEESSSSPQIGNLSGQQRNVSGVTPLGSIS